MSTRDRRRVTPWVALWWIPLLLLPPSSSGAEDRAAPGAEAAAADAAGVAARASDREVLRALAARDEPDPWLVADVLLRRGERVAAEVFSAAALRLDTGGLAAYVSSWQGLPADPEREARVASANAAIQRRAPDAALQSLGDPESGEVRDVLGVRLTFGRALALQALARPAAAQEQYTRTAEAAERIGWLSRAARAWLWGGLVAYEGALYPQARASLERARDLNERRYHPGGVAAADANLGNVDLAQGRLVEALACYERARANYERLGAKPPLFTVLNNIACVREKLGEYDAALLSHERVLAEVQRLGDARAVATSLGNLGLVLARLHRLPEAQSTLERAERAAEEVGDTAAATRARSNLALVHAGLGNRTRAEAYYRQAIGEMDAAGDQGGAAITLTGLGALQMQTGQLTRALGSLQQAREMFERMGNAREAAAVLGNIGAVHVILGDLAEGLSHLEQALARQEALGDRVRAAETLGLLVGAILRLGDEEKAIAVGQRALAAQEALGLKRSAASTLNNLAAAHRSLGDQAGAVEAFERARSLAAAAGDRRLAATLLANLGTLQRDLGEGQAALATYQQAQAAMEAAGDRVGAAGTWSDIGGLLATLGRRPEARTAFDRAIREAKHLRLAHELHLALGGLALLHLQMGASGKALATAQAALRELEEMMGGLGEEEGTSVREKYADLFGIGALAAAREEDVPLVVEFLENGRAGALLDALGRRDVLQWRTETLPEGLRAAEAAAREANGAARRAYDHALAGGDRRARATALRELDDSADLLRSVASRIQREAKREAGLFYPRAAPLEEIQGALEEREALVLYGLCLEEVWAVVVRPGDARLVALGTSADVREACAALAASDADVDAAPGLERLRSLLVAPLGLEDGVDLVLVSPEGPLCYVPFGALFSLPVALSPSGTTHALLRQEEPGPGDGVLALGDPDYSRPSEGSQAIYRRGGSLTPLPATRTEVERIGTTRLLGPEATEDSLRAALKGRKRWRAVHLACHGLVDPERPTLSSLALSRAGEQDGFLTALEVLRMEIPADLAVLSACETAKGRIVGGEGILGLTRAFLYAGSSRVLCSLWKVDDEATAALMAEFYERWNGSPGKLGVSASAALRAAQEHVRSQDRWSHPYYWAAWVLWGLP